MCDEIDEYSSCWWARWRKAAKPHRCCACRETIRRGDHYRFTSGVFDHTPFSFRHCMRCHAIYKAICDANPRMSVDVELSCGETWVNPPEDVAALAFLLPGEDPAALRQFDGGGA